MELMYELMGITSIFELGEKRKNKTGTRMPGDRERKDTDLDKKLLRCPKPSSFLQYDIVVKSFLPGLVYLSCMILDK